MTALSIEALRELLDYEPTTGALTWRKYQGRMTAGQPAGRPNDGHIEIRVNGKIQQAHRLAWAIHHGEWPTQQIDHINGNGLDNRIENLRDVSHALNQQNRQRPQSNSKTGYLGVIWEAARQKYRAQIRLNGRTVVLGRFSDPQEAQAAYFAAKERHHPGSVIPQEVPGCKLVQATRLEVL